MQIPLDWYIYIPPGFIVISSLLMCLTVRGAQDFFRKDLQSWIGLTVFWGLVAYLIGMTINSSIVAIYNVDRFNDFDGDNWAMLVAKDKMSVLSTLEAGYQTAVLLRTIAGGFLFASIIAVINCFRRSKDFLTYRILLTICLLFGFLSFFDHYNYFMWNHRLVQSKIMQIVKSDFH